MILFRRLLFILLAYAIATGTATLALEFIGNLRLMAEGQSLPVDGAAAWLLDPWQWLGVTLGAAVPAAIAIALVEGRRLHGLLINMGLGGLVGLVTLAGQFYHVGAVLRVEPVLVVGMAGLVGGVVYWALMRTVR